MREIKFRAWDKINKKLLKVVRLDWSSTLVICVDEKNTIYEIHQDNVEKMQYTGLKDKNGKEIYEGDIIRHQKADVKMVVDFIESVVDGISFRHYTGYYLGGRSSNQYEVIGNAYENPELLK